MAEDVFILGIVMTKFGKHPDKGCDRPCRVGGRARRRWPTAA